LMITYKLLHDILFVFLFSFFVMLVAEGALPGIFSNHISISLFAAGTLLAAFGIIYIGKKLEFTYKTANKKNGMLPIIILLSFLLIGNSLLRFAFWQNMLITIATLSVFFLIYNLIFTEK
jgi:hypothetical protein